MNPYIAIGFVALVFAGGWQSRSWYEDSKDLASAQAIDKSREVMRELAGEVSKNTEQAIKGIRVENRNIYNEVQREVRENTVYRDCVVPDGGLQLINKARDRAAAGKPDGALRPASEATAKK